MQFFLRNLLWSQGTSLIIGLVAAGILSFLFLPLALLFIVPFFGFCLFFFRNPIRVCNSAFCDSNALIAPCDGKILEVQEFDPHVDGFAYKMSIFLSPLDVHVNWMPCAGTVEKIMYNKGSFYPAFLPKSSLLNERNDVYIRSLKGHTICIRQITGTIARTIACWVNEKQKVQAGDTFGMMKFGSRIDLFLPQEVIIKIAPGDYVRGGETVIAQWSI